MSVQARSADFDIAVAVLHRMSEHVGSPGFDIIELHL